MDLGRVGIWSAGLMASAEAGEAAAELEELGYGAVWLGRSPGVRHTRPLLAATSRLVVATGILSIWDYEADDVAREHIEVTREYPERFLLGLGVSHGHAVGDAYRHPYQKMLGYLDGLDAAGVPASQRALAALGPRMLATSRDRSLGAHPYFVTPEHTRRAREILGDGPLLAPEVKVVLGDDAARGREVAREHLAVYAAMPNYVRSMVRLGFREDELSGGGSDRVVDAFFAVGGLDAVRARMAEHFAAGADHVALQAVIPNRFDLARDQWRALAPVITT